MRIGFHVSIMKSIDKAVDRAVDSGYTTFQIFTGNPRRWRPKELNLKESAAFIEKVEGNDVKPVFAHMPYLPNLASPKEDVYVRSCDALKRELRRCARLEIPYLVTHLGSHLGVGMQIGLVNIINAVNMAFEVVDTSVMLLLENSAGTRNSMGGSFENIQNIIEGSNCPERVGLCLDTSHAYASGIDLRTTEDVEGIIRRLDETVGFERLKLVHLNDSKGDLNSRIDRHEHIGMGKIGEEGFRNVLRSRLRQIPLILETPRDSRCSDVENFRKVRELAYHVRAHVS